MKEGYCVVLVKESYQYGLVNAEIVKKGEPIIFDTYEEAERYKKILENLYPMLRHEVAKVKVEEVEE